jgi:hypothetical protein
MKIEPLRKFGLPEGKLTEVDPAEVLRFREAVQDQVVRPLRAGEAERRAAIDEARRWYVG